MKNNVQYKWQRYESAAEVKMCHVLFLWTLLFIIAHFTIFLKCLIKSFTSVSIPQGIGNLFFLLDCLTEDIKKVGRGLS